MDIAIEIDEFVSNIHPVSRSNRLYYNHHHHCCCCSNFRFVFFVVAVAGNPLPFLPWCWCQRSGPVFFLLGRTKTRYGVCCCCCTCIDIYRNRKSIFVVVGTGIDTTFEIGLSLVLRLHLHLLMYYKVQQQIEMDKLVSNIHPVSWSNWSYYNHHHCCYCSDFHFVPFVFFVVAVAGDCFTTL